jgi:hypothetical protein
MSSAADALSNALYEASSTPLNAPPAAARAALSQVPLRALDSYLRTVPAQPHRSTVLPSERITALAHAYLTQVPRRGALLQHLVQHIVEITGYDRRRVCTVIRQNFESNDILVWQ